MAVPGGALRLYEDGNRTLRIAVLFSIALHALLLVALPSLRETQSKRSIASVAIVARLVDPRPAPVTVPVPPVPIQEAKRPVPAPAAKRPVPTRPAPDAVSIAPPRSKPAETEAPTTPAPPVAAAAPASPAVAVAAVPAAMAAAPSVAIATIPAATPEPLRAPPPSNAPDAGTLAQYRLAIIGAAKRYKRYPRLALDNNWQGKVEVRMAVAASGAISALSVRTSTGHQVLDQQALEMIEMAKAESQIPPALRGKEFFLDVPVIFSLREPDA